MTALTTHAHRPQFWIWAAWVFLIQQKIVRTEENARGYPPLAWIVLAPSPLRDYLSFWEHYRDVPWTREHFL